MVEMTDEMMAQMKLLSVEMTVRMMVCELVQMLAEMKAEMTVKMKGCVSAVSLAEQTD